MSKAVASSRSPPAGRGGAWRGVAGPAQASGREPEGAVGRKKKKKKAGVLPWAGDATAWVRGPYPASRSRCVCWSEGPLETELRASGRSC
ncbi:hypothetical protein R5R35_009529 [Gryllus longicercus]|uniref:Uncharacterized protein n=1 Tax=Gryllus longicercus TaxID=2509291 RepID=A0AAN9VK59_9ORTH